MLVISRQLGERFRIKCPTGELVWVSIQEVVDRKKVRIGIVAPKHVEVLREELIERALGEGQP